MSGRKKKQPKLKINAFFQKFTENNPKFYKKVLYTQNMHNVIQRLKEENKTHYNEVLFRILLIGLKNFTLEEAVNIINERDSIVDNFFIKDEIKKQEATEEEKARLKKKELATMIWTTRR